jgi:transposase
MPPMGFAMTRSRHAWTLQGRSSASGVSASLRNGWRDSRRSPGEAGPRAFPPSVVVAVKALACQLPFECGRPLSRWSLSEFKREVLRRGIVASVGESTLWRWLAQDAIRPWTHRSWIFPRDPDFEAKACRVLDLYEGRWKGRRLQPADCVISADEKSGIQILKRRHSIVAPSQGRPALVEHEYRRKGTLAYLAAWDVRRARLYGRCEPKVGIAPFERLVAQVMNDEPYHSAPRVFWILDNGTSHRGRRCIERFHQRWPNAVVVHLPKHASWLNQIEIFFSIVQRKVLTPADFDSVQDLEDRLLRFQDHYQQVAKPFEWRFTRRDLAKLLRKLHSRITQTAA